MLWFVQIHQLWCTFFWKFFSSSLTLLLHTSNRSQLIFSFNKLSFSTPHTSSTFTPFNPPSPTLHHPLPFSHPLHLPFFLLPPPLPPPQANGLQSQSSARELSVMSTTWNLVRLMSSECPPSTNWARVNLSSPPSPLSPSIHSVGAECLLSPFV